MQEERTMRRRKKRRKKSKFGYYLYAIVMLLLTVANIVLFVLILTFTQKIQVVGSTLGQEDQILSWVKEDPKTKNALYTFWKYRFGSYEIPVYLESVNVKMTAPWAVRVEVTEKQIIGGIQKEDTYLYFDAEGLVLRKGTEQLENVPIIEGLEGNDAAQFEVLEVDDEKVFSYIVNITELLKKYELSPDRLVWDDDCMQLYFDQICVRIGKLNFEEKILQLPPVLEKLEGKAGTLNMEYYTNDSSSISFQEKIE